MSLSMSSSSSSSSNDTNDSKSSNVQVVLRCRPSTENERRSADLGHISLRAENHEVHLNAAVKGKNTKKTYTFDTVFGPGSTQEDVYQQTVRPLVEEVLAGFNCTVFAYGQTGTGKTYTMEGHLTSNIRSKDAGVIPRSVHTIFDQLERQGVESSVKVSFLEIYNEELTDLLAEEGDPSEQRELRIFEDSTGKRGILVNNLEEVLVSNSAEVFALLQKSWQKRRTAETLLNKNSSRSHCVFIITVHTKESDEEGEDIIKTGKLYLVDLAGSECVGKSGAQNARAKEAGNINKSLLTLGRVINSLVDKTSYVPYRDSKLTRLLQESLGGRAKTVIIATISPAASALDETASTLDYAHRAKNIKNRPQVNQKISKRAYMRELESEINQLKSLNDALRLKNGVYLPPAQYEEMVQQIKSDAARLEESAMLLASKEAEYKELSEMIACKEAEYKELEVEKLGVETELASTQAHLTTTRTELVTTHAQLAHTSEVLHVTKQQLSATEDRLDETSHLVEQHQHTEVELLQQAQGVVHQLEGVLVDKDRLHDKIDDMSALELHNWQAAENVLEDVQTGIEEARQVVQSLHDEQAPRLQRLQEQTQQLDDDVSSFHRDARDLVASHAQQHSTATEQLIHSIATYEKDADEEAAAFGASIDDQRAQVVSHCEHASQTATSSLREAREHVDTLQADAHAHVQRVQSARAEGTRHRESFIDAASESLASMTASHTRFGTSHRSALESRVNTVERFLKRQREESELLTANLLAGVQTLIQDYRRKQEQSMNESLTELVHAVQADMRHVDEWTTDMESQSAGLSAHLVQYRTQSHAMAADCDQLVRSVDDDVKRQSVVLTSQLSSISQSIDAQFAQLQQLADTHRDHGRQHVERSRASVQQVAAEHIAGLQSAEQACSAFAEQHEDRSVRAHGVVARYTHEVQHELSGLSSLVKESNEMHGHRVDQVDGRMRTFVNDEFKHDRPTGRTPTKVKPLYRTEFVQTRPHGEILSVYRASKKRHCESSGSELGLFSSASSVSSTDSSHRSIASLDGVNVNMSMDDEPMSESGRSEEAATRPSSVQPLSRASATVRPASAQIGSRSTSLFPLTDCLADASSSANASATVEEKVRRRSDSSLSRQPFGGLGASASLSRSSSSKSNSPVTSGAIRAIAPVAGVEAAAGVSALPPTVASAGAGAGAGSVGTSSQSPTLGSQSLLSSSSSSSQSTSKKVKRTNSSLLPTAAMSRSSALDDENAPPPSTNVAHGSMSMMADGHEKSPSSGTGASVYASVQKPNVAAMVAALSDPTPVAASTGAPASYGSVGVPMEVDTAASGAAASSSSSATSTVAPISAVSAIALPSLSRTKTLKPGMRLHFGGASSSSSTSSSSGTGIPMFGGIVASAAMMVASSAAPSHTHVQAAVSATTETAVARPMTPTSSH